MSAPPMKILCRYQYDPLDRLVGLKPLENPGTQRFYQEDELVNEIEDQSQLTIMRHGPQPLAQRSGTAAAAAAETTLLATDQQRSLLRTVADADSRQMAYTAYGYRTGESGLSCLLGFNGERPESITGHYLLGQGNRAFNPVLMRFNSPDELSPFGDGGINAYAYCGNDPVNRYDPSGNIAYHLIQRRNALAEIASLPIQRPARTRTPPIVTHTSKTETNQSVKLIANNHSTPETIFGIPNKPPERLKKFPAEGPARSSFAPRNGQQSKSSSGSGARTIKAREYDELIDDLLREYPDSLVPIRQSLETDFHTATSALAE
ncbi:RHS repeat-associated core domain-containing protein, partial [Pseudomonas sp. Q12-87]|uniref:RHS repeat-associated core domain-containing protein n=1 Tax=Pseudomonas sp. Q12-87 TaxID=177989 RepID=UPI000AB1E234